MNQTAFMWVDIADSVNLLEKVGNEKYAIMLEDYFSCAEKHSRLHCAEIISELGDGFGAKSSRKSVDDLLDMFFELKNDLEKSSDLRIKAGVHFGDYTVSNTIQNGRVRKIFVGAVVKASRSESLCKKLGSSIVLTKESFRELKNQFYRKIFKPVKGEFCVKNTIQNEVYIFSKKVSNSIILPVVENFDVSSGILTESF